MTKKYSTSVLIFKLIFIDCIGILLFISYFGIITFLFRSIQKKIFLFVFFNCRRASLKDLGFLFFFISSENYIDK